MLSVLPNRACIPCKRLGIDPDAQRVYRMVFILRALETSAHGVCALSENLSNLFLKNQVCD
jgi:hypothetical protein